MNHLDPQAIASALAKLPETLRPLSHGLDHLGVAVESVDDNLRLYRDLLGLELVYEEVVESDGVRVAVLDLGHAHLELLEPTTPDSPIASYLERRGSGLHHLALAVDDCRRALEVSAAAGLRLIDSTPRRGAGGKSIGFLHPKSTGGVLLELCQTDSSGH